MYEEHVPTDKVMQHIRKFVPYISSKAHLVLIPRTCLKPANPHHKRLFNCALFADKLPSPRALSTGT